MRISALFLGGNIVKKRIFAVIIILIFLFTQSSVVLARGRFSSGRSFSVRSKGFSGFSTPKKSSGYAGSSSKKSPSSSARSVPGSYSKGKSTTGAKAKTTTARSAYMKDTFKTTTSKNNYSAYKKGLNDQQKKAYDSSMNNSYKMNSRMNFDDAIRTRPQRVSSFNSRPIFMNYNPGIFGGPFSYGYAFVGPWDMWFLMRASEMFWFHHWADISPYRNNFNNAEFAKMEERVKKLEAEGVAKDPNYLEPGVDPDLQLTTDYQEKHLDSIYYTDKNPGNTGSTVLTIIIVGAVITLLIIIIRKEVRPKKKKGSYSKIY
jgi:hypothetical protein